MKMLTSLLGTIFISREREKYIFFFKIYIMRCKKLKKFLLL